MAVQPRRNYQTVDGLRGVGAYLVVMRHVPGLFGPAHVPESFLAVDLFYLVSGFVVAHAYGERLQAGGFVRRFMATRIIRLYPLYLFGLALGLVPATIAAVGDPEGWWNPGRIVEAAATGLFMIPLFPGLAANGTSLDGPTWTLLPELVANLAYALVIRFLNRWVLGAIIAVSGAGVIYAELRFGTLDVGFSATDQWAALARVGFSFFMGVLLFGLFGDRKRQSGWIAWTCMAVLGLALAFNPSHAALPYYELGVVLLGFPALLVVAGRFEPGAISGRLFSFIGLISYGVYILHQPLGVLSREAFEYFDNLPEDPSGLIYGPAFLALVTLLAWQLDRRYDGPVRQLLNARFMRPRPAPQIGAGAGR